MKKSILTAIIGLLALAPIAASAGITAGTTLTGRMDQSIDSGNAVVGQPFTISNVHSQDRNIHDGTIYGHVADVVKPGQGRPAQIQLAYDKLHTSGGASYAISGNTVKLEVDTKSNALKEVGGAAAGAIVGSIIGRSLLHTNLGAPIGAAGGYIAAKNNRAGVSIPQNSVVQVQILHARPQARR